jgi:hypothetical protein
VLGALSLIAEEYHNISPGSVSALWEKWYKISYVHGSGVSAYIKMIRGDAERINCDGMFLVRERPGPGFADQLQRCVDAIRTAGGSEFDSEIALAQTMLDSAAVSRSNLVTFSKKCKITGSYKFLNASTTPGNQAFVASVYPLDNRARALADMICNVCGGRGHKSQDCATAKITTPRPDDGTSKPQTNVDREFTFRDSAGTPGRGASKRGTKRHQRPLERRISAEEWAALPFVKGTTKPCSVSVGGKRSAAASTATPSVPCCRLRRRRRLPRLLSLAGRLRSPRSLDRTPAKPPYRHARRRVATLQALSR